MYLDKENLCDSVDFEIITCTPIYSLCLFKGFEDIHCYLYFLYLLIGICLKAFEVHILINHFLGPHIH